MSDVLTHYDSDEEEMANRRSAVSQENLTGRKDNANRDHEKVNKPTSSNSAAENSASLADRESDAQFGSSAQDDIRDRLGLNYTGEGKDSKKSKVLSKMFGGKSAVKKRIAIAGAAAGGSLIAGSVAFIALLPLKIETIVNKLGDDANAATNNAMSTTGNRLVSTYLVKYVIPGLKNGTCRDVVSASCVSTIDGDSPISKMYRGFKEARLESKLATNYGIVLGAKGSGVNRQIYLSLNGNTAWTDGSEVTRQSIFDGMDNNGAKKVSRQALQDALDRATENETSWKKAYTRFKLAKLLKHKYGAKYCLLACNNKLVQGKLKITDKAADLRQAGKAYFLRNSIGVYNEGASLIMECVFSGQCDVNSLANAEPGDTERLSPAQKDLQTRLASYSSRFGEDKLKDLVEKANNVNKEGGLSRYASKQLATKIGEKVGGSAAGDLAGQAVEKFATPIGWVMTIAQIAHVGKEIGPLVKVMGYSASAAAAVGAYSTYQTMASEVKSGNTDAAALGSFNELLSTNMDGSSSDTSDATQTPMYQSLMGTDLNNGVTASIFGSMFGNTINMSTNGYKCNDGKPVPTGSLVCEEEQFNKGNSSLDSLSSALDIPGLNQLGDIVSAIQGGIGSAVGSVFQTLCIFPCSTILNTITGSLSTYVGKFMDWLLHKMIVSPFSEHQSGGRTFDMMAAGASIGANDGCNVTLGCEKASAAQAAATYNNYVAKSKRQFESQPLVAKVFSTTTPYSLVSHLAVSMPGSASTMMSSSIGSIVVNPLSSIVSGFGNAFSRSGTAFAATAASPFAAFGGTQNIFPDNKIPTDPEAFWNSNCQTGQYGTYDASNGKFDASTWLNNHQFIDPENGTTYNDDVNPCLLIQTTVQSYGARYDPSLIADDYDDTSSNSSTGETGTAPTGDTKQLAQQVVDLYDKKQIDFENTSDLDSFKKTAAGQSMTCTDDYKTVSLSQIAPETSKLIIQLAAKNKFTISAVFSGHGGHSTNPPNNGCTDGGRHPLGRAVDITIINGTHIWKGNAAGDTAFINEALSYLPKGSFVNGDPVNMGGIGQIYCHEEGFTFPTIPKGINSFDDGCSHLHLDVGVASPANSAGVAQ